MRKKISGWLILALLMFPTVLLAAGAEDSLEQRYVADVALQTEAQFLQLLERAEQLLMAGVALPDEDAKVVFVLHGPVLNSLVRRNYLENKRLVDLAASLSALHVIDVRACSAWMASHGIAEQDLQPFIEEVAYGPEFVDRLVKEENYLYF